MSAGTSRACAARESDPAYTIAHNLCDAARELRLDALIVPTLSGRSARLVSAHRPTVPIYALSPGKETVRRCGLMWGVQAASMRRHETTEALIADAARRVVELGWCKRGAARGDHRGPALRPPGNDQPRCRSRCSELAARVAAGRVSRRAAARTRLSCRRRTARPSAWRLSPADTARSRRACVQDRAGAA